MKAADVLQINRDRLSRWAKRLAENHATAFVAIGIGHDHMSGKEVLCVCEDGPDAATLAKFLRGIADQLEAQS